MPPGTRAASGWLALLVVLAGCADEAPTAPAARPERAPAAAPARHAAPAAPGTLVIRRTTSIARAGKSGARTERHETWSVADSALSRRAGVTMLRGTSPKDLTPETAAGFTPALVLQLPARAASAVCTNAPAWQRESRVGDLTVVARGRGDEPWSSVEAWSAGRLVSRTRTEWERRRGSWQLVSQEEQAVGGGATRTLTVDRSALRRAPGDEALPRLACADPKSGYVPPSPVAAAVTNGVAPSWTAGVGPVGLAGLELAGAFRFAAEEMCAPTEEEAEAACEFQRIALFVASAALGVAAANMWTACMPPAVFLGVPCLGAIAAYTVASGAVATAEQAYYECKEKALFPKPCSCSTTPTAPASDTDAIGAARTSRDGPALPPAARFGLDCTEPEAPATGGGGSGETGDDPTGHWATVCTYIDYYDEWGDYMYTEFLGCKVVWIA